MSVKIKPCPFCGFEDVIMESNGIGDFYVSCPLDTDDEGAPAGCGARMSDYRCESQEAAAQRWNNRSSFPPDDRADGDALNFATEKLLDYMEEEGKKQFSGPFPRDNYREGFRKYVGVVVAAYFANRSPKEQP